MPGVNRLQKYWLECLDRGTPCQLPDRRRRGQDARRERFDVDPLARRLCVVMLIHRLAFGEH